MKKTHRFYASLHAFSDHVLQAAKALSGSAAQPEFSDRSENTAQQYDRLLAGLSDAFVTPIDREDLLLCAQSLYTLENALNTLCYASSIYRIKPKHSEYIITICALLQRAVHALGHKSAPILTFLREGKEHIEYAKRACLRDYQDLSRLKIHSSYGVAHIQFQLSNMLMVFSLCLDTIHTLEVIAVKHI
ncbi:MAG: hypothetical protein ACOYJC_05135 [Christensenellales bacterium]|jgi:hypothetical protein